MVYIYKYEDKIHYVSKSEVDIKMRNVLSSKGQRTHMQ